MKNLILFFFLFPSYFSFAQDFVPPRTIKIEHAGSQNSIYYSAIFYDDISARQKIGKDNFYISDAIYYYVYVGKQQFDQIALLTYYLVAPYKDPESYYYVSYKVSGKKVIGRVVNEGAAIRSFCKNILSIMRQDTGNKENIKFFEEHGY